MVKVSYCFLLVALGAFTSAFPHEEYQYDPELDEVYEVDSPAAAYQLYRLKRSLQPGAPNFPSPPGQNGGWSVNPTISGDQNGNTRTNVEVQHKGKDHDFNAGWGKVVRGPNKAKPTWHVGGTYRW